MTPKPRQSDSGATGLPSLGDAKDQARRMRAELAAVGVRIGHSQALERVAHRHGFRDWNTLAAAIARDPKQEKRSARTWAVDDRVRGRYLAQPFTARVASVETLEPGWVRLALDLDEAVDVVTFDSFSAFRKWIRGVIGPDGRTRERTSDGRPHIELDLRPV